MTTDPQFPKLAWCGIGNLGRPIVERLSAAGAEPALFDVREAATADLADRLPVAKTPADAARDVELVFSTITDDDALRAVALGDDGVLAGLEKGGVYCDLSTVSPQASADVAAAARAAGVHYVRGAISGSVALARTGQLAVLASGPIEAYARCRPVFEAFSASQLHVGEAEDARVLKLMINNIAAATTAAAAESIAFGLKGGVDYDTILDVIDGSVIASPLLKYKIPPLRARDYTPTFTTRLMLKDIDILMDAASAFGCDLPIGRASLATFEAQAAAGYGDEDFFAGVELMRQKAGVPEA